MVVSQKPGKLGPTLLLNTYRKCNWAKRNLPEIETDTCLTGCTVVYILKTKQIHPKLLVITRDIVRGICRWNLHKYWNAPNPSTLTSCSACTPVTYPPNSFAYFLISCVLTMFVVPLIQAIIWRVHTSKALIPLLIWWANTLLSCGSYDWLSCRCAIVWVYNICAV